MGECVLIVDDDGLVRRAMERTMKKSGFETILSGSAGEALEILEREEVDVVLSDQVMPDLPGTELLNRVRRFHPGVLRLLITGDPSLKVAQDAINRGKVHRYLRKPITAGDIAREVRAALEETHDLTARRLRRRMLTANPELSGPVMGGEVRVDRSTAASVLDGLRTTLGALPSRAAKPTSFTVSPPSSDSTSSQP